MTSTKHHYTASSCWCSWWSSICVQSMLLEKELVAADGLSRSPVQNSEPDTNKDVQAYVDAVEPTIPATDGWLAQIRQTTTTLNDQLSKAIKFTKDGWPKYMRDVPIGLWNLYGSIMSLVRLVMVGLADAESLAEDLLFWEKNISFPPALNVRYWHFTF